jgi:hypothetical protein
MTSTLTRRLQKIETRQRAVAASRWKAGIDQLLHSMDREHVTFVQEWMREHCGGLKLVPLPGESFPELLERLQPPALVRTVWLLMGSFITANTPVALGPEVAEVYLADPDAYPANSCEGCGYLLPTRSTIQPDGSYHHLASYEGECPVCGLDSRISREGLV